MAFYKQSVDFLPKLSAEELEETKKVSRASIYAAILPLLASIIWVIAVFINSQYKNEVIALDRSIAEKEQQISTYDDIRLTQTELVLKVEALSDVIGKNFSPKQFFNDISKTIRETGDAQTEIFAYSRTDDGTFSIEGSANSYLDLAKIMVVFRGKDQFDEVEIDSIQYDKKSDNVNFEVSFIYAVLDEQ